jgi:hypothetical protein
MKNCETVKEVQMPGCYSGVLKVNVGLEPGTEVSWLSTKEGHPMVYDGGNAVIDASGNIILDKEAIQIDYFNTYKFRLLDSVNNTLNIKGYDCYRLMPVKNANEVVDVVI